MSLTTQERSAIRRFLSERFNQSELKQLSFDLGADHELFSCDNKSDFALELYLYCEHRDQVGCLIQQMWRRRPQFSDWFSQLVPRLPSCDDYRQIQIILPDGTLLASEAEFRLLIANFFKIPAEQINILAVATGSNHILMNVPAAAFPLPAKQSISLDNGRIRILSIEEFVMLPAEMQETWRYIAVNHPPQVIDGSLYPTISWQAATVIVHGSEAETAVPTTDTTSDHWLARAANVAKVRAISCDLIVKLAPRESNRLKNVITDFVQAAQQGPISTMQQAQIAFGLGGKTDSLVAKVLPVLVTTVTNMLEEQQSQTLANLRIDHAQLSQMLEDAMKKQQIRRSQRNQLRPLLAEAIAKGIGDVYSSYEQELDTLSRQVGTTPEMLVLERQLRENVSQTRRNGDNPTLANRRRDLIRLLNDLARRETGQPFVDLHTKRSAN